jgi:putative NADPH-quinone reductase
MKASVLLAHPYPKSFNHAIFNQICSSLDAAGIETYSHDLYAEEFDPVLTVNELGLNKSEDPLVNQYADELMESDFLFFVHPNWWGQPPAMMKGYIDRVIRPPYAYDMPEGALSGLPIQKLKGKYGIVYTTSNTDAERETNYLGDPLNLIWQKGTFEFCGIDDYHRRMFRIISESE